MVRRLATCKQEIEAGRELAEQEFWAVTIGAGQARAHPADRECIREYNRELYGVNPGNSINEALDLAIENIHEPPERTEE